MYALALVTADGTLLDVQLNAVYRPSASADDLSFILASDLQWGTVPEVASANLKFISLLNAAAELPEAPEFVILSGDVVDCKFGSAGTLRSQLLGGANDYPRDYLQAWLALAGSRLPLYIVPGNHDGYRFEDPLGRTRSDGLLLFEDTFGPSYAAFDRPPFRFILANSYDLPKAFRTSRRSEQSNVLEKISDKLNTLNWGGGIGAAQLRWLRAQLGLDGAAPNTLIPILVCHHDPRGAFPALKQPKSPAVAWDRRRHMPISTPATDAAMMDLRLPPHSADTEEVHAGSYTPLRRYDSTLRNGDWFEVGLGGSMPSFLGFPGWSRYQQEWHIDLMYDGRWNRVTPQPPAADLLASPDAILRTMIEGKVRAVFKGHDNRFARSHMETGDSIFGQRAEDALLSLGADAGQLSPLRLSAPMSVFHNADIGDIDSDGHGMLWVRAQGQELTVLEVDLVW